MNGERSRVWPVAVFARNEAKRITACLDSLLRQTTNEPVSVHVLVNGCTDDTEAVVDRYAASHGAVHRHTLPIGDKASAWNAFVHEYCPAGAPAAFFVDGDMVICPGALGALAATLAATPQALVAAGVPATGRGRAWMTRLVARDHLVLGNLYAVSDAFLRRLRSSGFRMPRGYIGDDGLIASMAKWNLDPAGPFEDGRVAPCLDARFSFDSLSPFRAADWGVYYNKQIRYSMRHYQHMLLYPRLRTDGLRGVPTRVEALYRPGYVEGLTPRPATFLFDWIALRRIRASTPSTV